MNKILKIVIIAIIAILVIKLLLPILPSLILFTASAALGFMAYDWFKKNKSNFGILN